MKNLLLLCLPVLFFASLAGTAQQHQPNTKQEISELINSWHDAAARADFDAYFNKMADESIFIGTDPTENWAKDEFQAWAKPYFEQGSAWSFSTLERNIFLSEKDELAWFDELLDTHMGICRGSGLLKRENGKWRIKHYVLSIGIPNDKVAEVTRLKKDFDNSLISHLKSK